MPKNGILVIDIFILAGLYLVHLPGCSSVWLECLLGVQEVACSSQVTPIMLIVSEEEKSKIEK